MTMNDISQNEELLALRREIRFYREVTATLERENAELKAAREKFPSLEEVLTVYPYIGMSAGESAIVHITNAKQPMELEQLITEIVAKGAAVGKTSPRGVALKGIQQKPELEIRNGIVHLR